MAKMEKVVLKPGNAETALIIESLNLDKTANFSRLEYYLKQIVSGRDVVFETRSDTLFVVPAGEAWKIISSWGSDPSVNLPVGDSGGMKNRASHLLNYLQINISGKTAEAAANYRAIIEQANLDPAVNPLSQPAPDALTQSYQQALALRNAQLKILQSRFGLLASSLESSKLLEGVDPIYKPLIAQMLATNSGNLRHISNFTPDQLNQLFLHQAGPGVNNFIHHLYTKEAKEELYHLSQDIEGGITKIWGSEDAFQKDASDLRTLNTMSPTIGDLSWMVGGTIHASTNEQKAQLAKLIESLQTQTLASAQGQHVDGNEIIRRTLKQVGLNTDDETLKQYRGLIPYLEQIEIKERHTLLGSELFERDPQILATLGIAKALHVDEKIPWMRQQDLEALTKSILSQYGGSDLFTALQGELTESSPNLDKVAALTNLLKTTSEYRHYNQTLAGNPLLAAQDLLAKARGNYDSAKLPIDRFTRKIWGEYEKIDGVINWPQRKLVKWLGEQEDKYPWLNPAALILKKWTDFQTGIAIKIHGWAVGASTGHWFSGFAVHIVDFSEGFIKSQADWGQAGHYFFQRKWGNILNWTSQKVLHKTYDVAQKDFWLAVANSAKSIGNKFAAGLGDKVASLIGVATSEAGVGLIVLGGQVLWEVGKATLGKIWGTLSVLFGGKGDALENFGVVMLGGVFFALNSIMLGVPAIVLGAGKIIQIFLKIVWDGLITIFILAATISLILIATAFLLFSVFKTTVNLDSSAGVVAAINCQATGQTTSNPTANAAVCISQILTACSTNPLNENNVGQNWGCIVAGLVMYSPQTLITYLKDQLFADGWTSTKHLQCSGLVALSASAPGGSPLAQQNACTYASDHPKTYKYISGTSGMQPGDFFITGVDGCNASAVGHIGVVIDPNAGAEIVCVDANEVGPGVVRGPQEFKGSPACRFPKSLISGYLHKI